MGKVLPSQRLLKQFDERLVFGEMNLSEILRPVFTGTTTGMPIADSLK